MAEALVTLGLVCNVVQLVDAATKIVSIAAKIHKNNGEISLDAQRSHLLAEHLRNNRDLVILSKACTKADQSPSSPLSEFTASAETLISEDSIGLFDPRFQDLQLGHICQESSKIADELIDKLNAYAYKVEEDRNIFRSTKKAIKLLLDHRYIEEKSALLKEYQAQLDVKLSWFSIILLQRAEARTRDGFHRLNRNIGNVKQQLGDVLTTVKADNEANASRLSRQISTDSEHLHETLSGILEILSLSKPHEDENWVNIQRDNEPLADPTPLYEAAKEGNKDKIKDFLTKAKVNIDSPNGSGQTALHLACYYDHVVVARYLRRFCGADVNMEDKNGSTALHLAVQRGNVRVVRLLLGELGADPRPFDDHNKIPRDYVKSSNLGFVMAWMFDHGSNIESEEPVSHRTALIQAAANGDFDSVKQLLDENANVEAQDIQGSSALEQAARCGSIECVKELLSRGAEVKHRNKEDHTPLMVAVSLNKPQIAEELILAGSEINAMDETTGRNCVWQAAKLQHWQMVKLLVKKGADITSRDVEGYTLLARACQNGKPLLVEHLLKRVADPNEPGRDGWSGLHEAAHHGHNEVVQVLLQHPAIKINERCHRTMTPLLRACESCHIGVVRQLLATDKVDLDIQNGNGWTGLHEAGTQAGKGAEIVKLLLAAGANPNIQDKSGYSPLSRAVINGRIDTVSALLAYESTEVNVSLANEDGWTPLMEASLHGHLEIIQLLLQHGADIEACGTYHDKGDVKASHVTALMLAAKTGKVGAINILLTLAREPAANLHIKDSRGYSALTIAVKHGKSRAAFVLAEKGADIGDMLTHRSEITSPEAKVIIEMLEAWRK